MSCVHWLSHSIVCDPNLNYWVYMIDTAPYTHPSSFNFRQHLEATCKLSEASSACILILLVGGLRPVKDPLYLVQSVAGVKLINCYVYREVM